MGLGAWVLLVFIPLGYAIAIAISLFLEYLLFPFLNAIFKKSYGPTTIVQDIENFGENETFNEVKTLTQEQKIRLKQFCSENWGEALSGGAYEMLLKTHPEVLDEHEEKRDSVLMTQLIDDLSEFAPGRKWTEAIEFLAARLASSYVEERVFEESVGQGGKRTLIGHFHESFIPAGLIGTIASSLDNGATERAYHNFVAVDEIFKEIARGQNATHDPEKVARLWQLALANLNTSFSKLESSIALIPN